MSDASFKSLKGMVVLVVEDNEINRLVITNILSQWEIVVDTANNGSVALSMLKERRYDLLLMDINMPEMDGYDTTRTIRAEGGIEYGEVPIFALTQLDTPEYIDEIYDSGMTGYIRKPVDVEKLYRKISPYHKG
jgi:CheY-like chemotaxis protein